MDGTVSDEKGQFQLQLAKDNYLLKIEFIGFESQELEIELKKDLDLDPTYTDKVELNFLKQWDKLTINPAIYASTASDYFEFVIDQEVSSR